MSSIGIRHGYSVQQKDGRTLIYANDGSVFHDFGRNVDAAVYEAVIEAWRSGFEAGVAHGGQQARETIQKTVKTALGIG